MSTSPDISAITLQNRIVEYWQSQQPIFEKIYKTGMEEYLKASPTAKMAFACNDGCLGCIDEGLSGQEHLAGSGILWENREELKKHVIKAKIKKIYSHSHCGAAKLYAQRHNLDVSKSDEYGMEFAKNLAKELGILWEHLGESKLHRPVGFHIARIIYYDATNHFDYKLSSCFPPGFEVSRGLSDKKHALEEVKICAGLILDTKGGFGSLIDEEHPIIICPISSSNDKVLNRSVLTEEIANLLPSLNAEFGKKFFVTGFTAPRYNLLDKINLQSYFKINKHI